MGKYKQYEYTFKDYLEDRKVQASDFNSVETPFVHSRWENVEPSVGNLFANPKSKNGLSTQDQVLQGLQDVSNYLHNKVNLFLGKESLKDFTKRFFNNVDKKTGKITFSRRECMRRVLNDPEIIDFIYKKFYYTDDRNGFKNGFDEREIQIMFGKALSNGMQKLVSSKDFISETVNIIKSGVSKEAKKKKINAKELGDILIDLFNGEAWKTAVNQVMADFLKNKTTKKQYLLDGTTTKDLLAKIYKQIRINKNVKQMTPNLEKLIYLIRNKLFPKKKAEMLKGQIKDFQDKEKTLAFLDEDDDKYLRRFSAAIRRYFEDGIESMFSSKNRWYEVISDDLLTMAINIDTDTNNFMFSIGDIADMQMFIKGVDAKQINEEIQKKFELKLNKLIDTIPDEKKHGQGSIQENNAWGRTKKNSDEILAFGENRRVDTRIRESFKKSRAIQTFRGSNKFSISDSIIYNDNTGEFARVQIKNYQTAYQKFLGLDDKNKGGGMTVGLMSRDSMLFKDFQDMMQKTGQSMLKQKDYNRMSYLIANLAYFSHYRDTVKFQGRGKTIGYGKKVDTSALRKTISDLIGLEIKNIIGINLPTRMELKNSVASANLFYLVNNEYFVPTYAIIDELINLYSKNDPDKKNMTHTGATIDVSKIGGVLDGFKNYTIYDKEHSWRYHNIWTGILREKQRTGDRDSVARKVGKLLIDKAMVSNLTLNFDFREMANNAYSLTMK